MIIVNNNVKSVKPLLFLEQRFFVIVYCKKAYFYYLCESKYNFMKTILLSLMLLLSQTTFAQYTFKKLTQEGVTRTKVPAIAPIPKSWGDTSVTVYSGGSVEMLKYFVDGEIYDNIFNPNPTGLYLNKQHFYFFCDPDKTIKQSVSDIADTYEFTYLGKNYLCVFTLREQAVESKYKCYNLFDITDPKKITQVSFPSIHVGDDSFGDFNFDGTIDFLTVINRKPDGFKQKLHSTAYMVRAYTFTNGAARSLVNDKTKLPHYIYGLCDENMDNFNVLQCDWMMKLKDSTGVEVKVADYYPVYEPFEVKDNAIYTTEGVKVEKNKYSVVVGRFSDEGGATQICEELKKKNLGNGHGYELFIMMDQYNGDIMWIVVVGNYVTKAQAQQAMQTLKQHGYGNVELKDLRNAY
jgi:hypothetical protein